MSSYLKTAANRNQGTTVQIEQAREDQVVNNAGGYVFSQDAWLKVRSFLILGAEGGTYYVGEKELTKQNTTNLQACLKENGPKLVQLIREVSVNGLAPKQAATLFALALAAADGDLATRAEVLKVRDEVLRTGSHLEEFAGYLLSLGSKSSRFTRKLLGGWYAKPIDDLAYQAVKYQTREGVSHRDILRVAHPKPASAAHDHLFKWVVDGSAATKPVPEKFANRVNVKALKSSLQLPAIIQAFERAKAATTESEIVQLIAEHNLPRECIPTQWLNSVAVWEALLAKMPLTALIRNLGKMSSVGLLKPLTAASKLVVEKLNDQDYLTKSRIHPIGVLSALKTYESGHGVRGKLSWEPVRQVVDSLDGAFYKTFKNVEPTNKNFLLALDVSGSMSMGDVGGVPGLSPREASAAMALVTAATEPNYEIFGFSTSFVKLNITPKMRLDQAVKAINGLPFSGTDCSLPVQYADQQGLDVDTFIVYTDSETYAGRIHPFQALKKYRAKTGKFAKLIVVGMVSNGFTIADPNDRGSLDVVGFDSSVPEVIRSFSLQD
jgi:60 kDa SS-A/Ro ribonucleoprotein